MNHNRERFNPADAYYSFGNALPPKDCLEEMSEILSEAECDSRLLLVHADVTVDLSTIDSDKSDKHIDHARTRLDEVIRIGRGKQDSRPTVEAHIKKAQLHAWEGAAKGKNIELFYDELLVGAVNAARAHKSNATKRGLSLLRSFVPVLLGARSGLQDQQWISRTSLSREASNEASRGLNHNSHWSLGLSLSSAPEDYIEPDIKVQVKKEFYRDEIGLYSGGEIRCLSTRKNHIDNPVAIIWGCQAEVEDGVSNGGYKSYDLDRLAQSIGETLHRSPKLIGGIKSARQLSTA